METTALSTFQHEKFGEIRTLIKEDGEPWFVAKEVAVALGYKNSREAIIEHCKGGSEMLLPSKGGNQLTKIIPESDLYRLILRSKLPQAEAFQDWVTSEVLPSIRKTAIHERAGEAAPEYPVGNSTESPKEAQAVQAFQHEKFGQVRTLIKEDGEPWFFAQEITKALDYGNNARTIKDNVDDEDILIRYIPELSNNYTLINESGLYSLILRSSKPEAKIFKKWVTSEVLPSIRKTGQYGSASVPPVPAPAPVLIIRQPITADLFIERDGFFWLSLEAIINAINTEKKLSLSMLSDMVMMISFLKGFFVTIDGNVYTRDEGIYFAGIMATEEKVKLDFFAQIKPVLDELQERKNKELKRTTVRAYQKAIYGVKSKEDLKILKKIVRYKQKDLTINEIAVLTGLKEIDVLARLRDIENSCLMDMPDLLDWIPVRNPPASPSAPAKITTEHMGEFYDILKELIIALGVYDAILLWHLRTMLVENKTQSITTTYADWFKEFPFKSETMLRKVVSRLEKKGIIVSERMGLLAKKYSISTEALKKCLAEKK